MKIGFVGAGKAGFSLGRYFTEHHVDVSGYYSRSKASAKEASVFTQTKYFETIEEIIASSDALFLTVPDGMVQNVWNSLKQYSLTGKFICHCSGAMSSAVFSGIDQTGAFGYSIHPLIAISDKLQSYRDLSQAYFTIEGEKEHLCCWQQFFSGLGNPLKVIAREQKALYHGAAVFVSNFMVGLFDKGAELLTQCGFAPEEAAQALMPLFVNNCRNIAAKGPVEALTGPVERADAKTLQKHLAVLDDEERILYTELSKILVKLSKEKHPGRDYGEIERLLQRGKEAGELQLEEREEDE